MQIVTEKNDTHIILDENESEKDVLRAIVKASFEMAEPVGLSAIDYQADDELTDAEADLLIRAEPRSYDSCMIDMDFVNGRQCKTMLMKDADRRFVLYGRYFERFRGAPGPVLNRAADMLSTIQKMRTAACPPLGCSPK